MPENQKREVSLRAGILRGIADGKIDLDQTGIWLRDQLCELAMCDPPLITTDGPAVLLTAKGWETLRAAEK